jgi:ABC-type dipeptide/oligopeptide/nickel transport system permease subunit
MLKHAAHRDLHPAVGMALPGAMIFITSIAFNMLSDSLFACSHG